MDGFQANRDVLLAGTQPPFGVSIIIPCHMCGDTLHETIQSIIAARPPAHIPFEIILGNDSPKDGLTRIAIQDAMVECAKVGVTVHAVEHDANKGVSAIRNTMLRQARFKYVWPIDSDDKLPKGSRFIEKATRIMERDANTAFVYPRSKYFGAVTKRHHIPLFSEKTAMVLDIIPCCAMYNTAELRAIGGYNESLNYNEDKEIALAVLARRLIDNGPNVPRRVRHLRTEGYLYRRYENGNNLSARTDPTDPKWSWPVRMANLVGRSGPLFDHHYKSRDPNEVTRQFRSSLRGLTEMTTARIVNVCRGERPPSHLFRIPTIFGRKPV